MLYPKNVPNWQRVIRIIIGLVLVGTAVNLLTQAGSVLLAIVLIAAALFLVVTGFVGWCPACALVGRRFKKGRVQG